jgi:NADH-quinone oxidoreductase subunit L
MDTSLATLIISSFYRFLFNVFFGKSIGKQLQDIGTVVILYCDFIFLGAIAAKPEGIQFLFDWIQISTFKVDFGFY